MSRDLPPAILEMHIGILGKTGSGKSNLAKTIVEGLLDDGARVCVIDPTGTWYGLRLLPDRSPSRYEVVMFGGNHADIAIGRTHGAAVAETIGTTTTPAVIDTRTMTVGERTEFFTAFAETLLQRNQGPLHLVIDEAHLFAPQGRVADPRSGAMLHAANNLVSLGRGVGLRIILISQRPAKLHKDSLTQIETLVAMRVIAPQDRRAVEDWIGEWAEPKQGAELVGSLASLKTGEAWIWSPEAGLLERRQTPLARTLDTGKPSAVPVELGSIDIDAVQERLGQVGKDIVANDPRELRKRIAELERAARATPATETVEKIVEVPVLNGQVVELREAMEVLGLVGSELDGTATKLLDVSERIVDVGRNVLTAIERVSSAPRPAAQPPRPPASNAGRSTGAPTLARPETGPREASGTSGIAAPPTGSRPAPPLDAGEVRLKAGARRMLSALAQLHPVMLTRSQMATLADVSPTSGTFSDYMSAIRTGGFLVEMGGQLGLTVAGQALMASELGRGAPSSAELLEMWGRKLKAGARRMLQVLHDAYPDGLTRAELGERAEIAITSGTFSDYMSMLRRNGLLDESQPGIVRAGEALFLGGRR